MQYVRLTYICKTEVRRLSNLGCTLSRTRGICIGYSMFCVGYGIYTRERSS